MPLVFLPSQLYHHDMTKLLYADLTYYLRGVGFRIHNALKGGHAECDYEAALVWALTTDGVPYRQQPVYRIAYKGQQIGEYRPDLVLADDDVIVELKAAPQIEPLHKAQTLSYLAVTQAQLGLIMNFGAKKLHVERLPNFVQQRQVAPQAATRRFDLLYSDLTEGILAALHEAHRVLGPGFLHQVYRRAARIELSDHRLNYRYIKELPLRFEGHTIAAKPTRLFYIEQKVLLATVALKKVTEAQREKLRWAMLQMDCRLGIIANFYPGALDTQFVRVGD